MPFEPLQIIFAGGCKTSIEAGLLPAGSFSFAQNVRNFHPGLGKRKGQSKLHTVADDVNKVMSIYQMVKANGSEKYTYAQFSDGDILKATNNPPTVTTGAFGSEVFDGSASAWPAAWSNLNDSLIYSDGVNLPQICAELSNLIGRFIVYDSASALPAVPDEGEDYTDEVSDNSAATVAVLDVLDAAEDCVLVCCPIMPNRLYFTITSGNVNASVMQIEYYKSGGWAVLTISDGTSSDGKTLAASGAVTWAQPTDALPKYMYGINGFWLKINFSAVLSATVRVSKVTYGSGWVPIQNVWDGIRVEAVEAQLYKNADATYLTCGSTSISVGGMVAADFLYFSSYDPIEMIYIDVGETPNKTAAVAVSMAYWTGSAWEAMGVSDGAVGLTKSGWVVFGKTPSQKQQFKKTFYYAHWYRIKVDKSLSSEAVIAIYCAPHFDIAAFNLGLTNCVWKGRNVIGSIKDHLLFVSAQNNAQCFNGADFAILEPGDGRQNIPVAMRRFKNELMVWQEERGVEGGCLTLFEGYSPATFGKIVISSKLGTMNHHSVEVVEGVLTSTKTDEIIKDLAYCLSRFGIYVCDGLYCSMISDDIQNYFDPTKPECIRYGYEKKMWLKYDSSEDVIRIGLVSGSAATEPNVFPVYDIATKTWSFDALGQNLSQMIEIEAGSGDVPVLQVGGGIADGVLYLLNSGVNDVAAAIDSYIKMEINRMGDVINLGKVILRCAAQAGGGSLILTLYSNSILKSSKTLSLLPEVTSQAVRRFNFYMNVTGNNISVKIQNNGVGEEMKLLSGVFECDAYPQ